MIEKLGIFAGEVSPTDMKLATKINELVDAVNELQTKAEILEENAHPTAKVDPYAEQRKWIDKLCWFWDFQREAAVIGILTDFETDNPQFRKDGMSWYQCCEPVKPNDDIIYQKD